MTNYAAIGRKKLLEIDGETGTRVEETLNGICPDLARYLIEYSFGEIYAREILDNRTKEQALIIWRFLRPRKGNWPNLLICLIKPGFPENLSIQMKFETGWG